jgi:hypothetical protein
MYFILAVYPPVAQEKIKKNDGEEKKKKRKKPRKKLEKGNGHHDHLQEKDLNG